MDPAASSDRQPFEPPFPALAALLLCCLWVAILSLPMLAGHFVAAPYNDQHSTGYAFRAWAAFQWKTLGHVPLWNPEIYGGLPFVAAMHGDIFYPTAFLRLILPTDVAMNLGFVVHYVLAGMFTYWFLRVLKVSWTGAVIGAVVYQLSGVIGSYVSPGHDGKLFVTAMLPLGLTALTLAIRDRRFEGYALFALSVGLALLSPHPQMAQYYVLAAGIYALYLTLGATVAGGVTTRLLPLGFALAAVAAGVLIAAIQYLPFLAYIPYSPRDVSVVASYDWSVSYAIPWQHVPEFFLSRFAGESFTGTYWATNGVKFHSEYLGLPALALAVLGVLDRDRRRFVWWLSGIAVLFLLVALGDGTPFFRLWWAVVPFVKSTRAPGMALFVVAFVVAVFAGFGVDRVQQGAGRRHAQVWLIVGGVIGVLGLLGFFNVLAESLAQGVQIATGRPSVQAVTNGAGAIRWGAAVSGGALLAVGAAAWAWHGRRMPAVAAALVLFAIVGGDLWRNARVFWNYSRAEELFAPDQIKTFLTSQDRPFRVWNLLYPQSSLMADGIAQWFGHHGNELHSFDLLHGREGIALTFAREGHPRLLDLYAIQYIVLPTAMAPESIPRFTRVLDDVPTSAGRNGTLFQRREPVPYARLVPAAIKLERDQTIATIIDPRLGLDRLVLLAPDAPVDAGPRPETQPAPLSVTPAVEAWEPGSMRIAIPGGAPQDAYLLVSENFYKDWRARVDGQAVPVVLGDGALLTVPVSAGAREVTLEFASPEYRTGKLLTLGSLLLVVVGFVVPAWARRRRVG